MELTGPNLRPGDEGSAESRNMREECRQCRLATILLVCLFMLTFPFEPGWIAPFTAKIAFILEMLL